MDHYWCTCTCTASLDSGWHWTSEAAFQSAFSSSDLIPSFFSPSENYSSFSEAAMSRMHLQDCADRGAFGFIFNHNPLSLVYHPCYNQVHIVGIVQVVDYRAEDIRSSFFSIARHGSWSFFKWCLSGWQICQSENLPCKLQPCPSLFLSYFPRPWSHLRVGLFICLPL